MFRIINQCLFLSIIIIAYSTILYELKAPRILWISARFYIEWDSSAKIARPYRSLLVGRPTQAKKVVRMVKGRINVVKTFLIQSTPTLAKDVKATSTTAIGFSSTSLHNTASITGSRSYRRTLIDSLVSRDSYGEQNEAWDRYMRHKSGDWTWAASFSSLFKPHSFRSPMWEGGHRMCHIVHWWI